MIYSDSWARHHFLYLEKKKVTYSVSAIGTNRTRIKEFSNLDLAMCWVGVREAAGRSL